MLTYSNDTFGGGFIIDTSLDDLGNKTGSARNIGTNKEYIHIHKDDGGRLELDNVEDGGGSCVGVGREDVVEEVGGSNKHIDSAGGSEVALDVDVGIGGVGNNNDKQSQQHVTAHTTHNTHTYPKSILRNTHNTHTQSKSKVGGTADNDEQIIEYLQSGVRHFVKSTPDDAPPTRKPLRGEQGMRFANIGRRPTGCRSSENMPLGKECWGFG